MKSLSGKIFSTVLIFTLAFVVAVSVTLTTIYYLTFEREAETMLCTMANEAAQRLDGQSAEKAVEMLSDQLDGMPRYTLIGPGGQVLFDSAVDSSQLENHGQRPEVVEARDAGQSVVWRFSNTLNTDTIYAAVRLNDGMIVRLSETRESLLSYAGSLVVPELIVLVVAALLVLALSRLLTRRIMKPIDALDFSEPLNNEIYKEMDPLLERIDHQQHLLKAQNEELAEAANMRREFSSNVSHEMKTPLQVISGYAELMQNGLVKPDDNRHFAGLIYEEAQAMRTLINDVLTLSRLDETAIDNAAKAPVSIDGVAARVISRLDSLADERHVRLQLETRDEGRAVIDGAETLVEEMLYNLVENGIRYNREGGEVRLSIACEPVKSFIEIGEHDNANRMAKDLSPQTDGRSSHHTALSSSLPTNDSHDNDFEVIIQVSDTGPGIPPELQEKIFERFFRMEKSRSKETGGTGLGLAIVKHAVLYHNGAIEVESTEGEGTTFTLKFPNSKEVLPASEG